MITDMITMDSTYLRIESVSCPRCEGTGRIVDDSSVGRIFRQLRQRKGISLREVARRIKLSAAYLSDLERGHKHWSLSLRGKYALALNLSPEEMPE